MTESNIEHDNDAPRVDEEDPHVASLLGDLGSTRQQHQPSIKEEDEEDQDDHETNRTSSTDPGAQPTLPPSNLISHVVPPEFVPRPDDQEFAWRQDPYAGSPGSKYPSYDLPVEHEEGDRAMELKLFSFKRPHMRALHCAWISFFLAFTIWFAPAPLLKEIQDTLGLTKQELWNSSITNDSAYYTYFVSVLAVLLAMHFVHLFHETDCSGSPLFLSLFLDFLYSHSHHSAVTAIVMRILIGPVCDAYGARIPMAVILCLAAIPTACVGLVQSSAGLSTIRFFIGIAGSSFVMAQFWPSRMFSREIAGTANGIVGGWGNLGGAFTQVFMGTILFPLFRDHVYDGNSEKAWRTICVIPAGMALMWGLTVSFISDDAPMGNYSEMRAEGTMDRIFMTTSLRSGAKLNTW